MVLPQEQSLDAAQVTAEASVPGDALKFARFREFDLPAAADSPTSMAIGSDGNAWAATTKRVVRVGPLGGIEAFHGPAGSQFAGGMVRGDDGALWLLGWVPGSQPGDTINVVFRVATDGSVKFFPLPDAAQGFDTFLADITDGADGRLWFVVQTTEPCGAVGSVTTDGNFGPVTTLCEPTSSQGARSIRSRVAHAADGTTYVTVFDRFSGDSSVQRISASGHVLRTIPLPANSDPEGIVEGHDSALWIMLDGANAIARLTFGGSLTTYPLPTKNALTPQFNLDLAQSSQIINGPRGPLWFIEANVNQIGRITLFGKISEYRIPTPNSGPSGIASCRPRCKSGFGPIWFAETAANKIGNIKV